MTTYIPFNPQPGSAFQFQATLDGNPYTVTCVSLVYGQRYYLNIVDDLNNPVVFIAQIGSPPDSDINIVGGYFSESTLVYRVNTGNFEINP